MAEHFGRAAAQTFKPTKTKGFNTMTTQEIQKQDWIGLYLEIDRIVVPKQSRKIDPVKLKELASSIKTHGVLTPILVRPYLETPASAAGEYELVFGERRLRAAKVAGLTVIPASVRDMSDAEALEARIVENLQREGVHPLDECDNYRALMQKHGYTAKDISSKVGKSQAYVYGRLKLAELVPDARKAFLEDRISASVAELIARIPVPELQAAAIESIGRGTWDDKDQRWSTGAASAFIHRNYMLGLSDASFSKSDELLVPEAGSCVRCPKRTGNQRELFADVKSADVCTDPTCFEKKRVAHWEIESAAAVEMGDRVLTEKEAKDVLAHTHHNSMHYQKYVDLESPCYDDPKKRKYKTLIGKGAVDRVLAKDGVGNVRRLATTRSVSKVLEAAGHDFAKKAAASSAGTSMSDKKKRAALKLRKGVALEALQAIAASKKPSDGAFWLLMISLADESVWSSAKEPVYARAGIKPGPTGAGRSKEIASSIKRFTASKARGIVLELFLQESINSMNLPSRGYPGRLLEACKHFGVDIKELEATAKELEASKAKPIKASKAKSVKASSKK